MKAVWFGLLLLVAAVGGGRRLPKWWRGTGPSYQSPRRERTFLTGLLAGVFILLFGFTAALVDRHGRPHWLSWSAFGFLAVGLLLLVLMPFVAYFGAFDFLVAPWLRRGAPARPAEPPAPAKAAPAKAASAKAGPAKAGSARLRKRRAKPSEPADGKGTLRIVRPANLWRDFVRAYQVEVDGSEVGRLRRGGELKLRVLPGPHTVRGVIDWTGSPALTVAVREGATTLVRLRPGDLNAREAIQTEDAYLRIELADHR